MKRFILFLTAILCVSPAIAEDDWIIFLMDTSGSMSDNMTVQNGSGKVHKIERIEAAKDAMVEVIDSIPAGTNVGLLTFYGWGYEPSKLEKQKLVQAIRSMSPNGGTPLGSYMKTAADQLLLARKRGDRGGTYTLIIVTDGEASDQHLVDSYLSDIISRGLIVKAIGLDMDKDHSLATVVHEYTNANDPATLQQQLKAYVAEASFKNQSATDEMFEELKGIPNDVAFAVIQELTEQRNYPIGEEPIVEVRNEDGSTQMVPNEPGLANKVSDEGVSWWIIGIIVVCVLVFFGFVAFISSR